MARPELRWGVGTLVWITLGSPAFALPLDRTAVLDQLSVTPVGTVQFPFTHRFTVQPNKVVSTPTYSLSTGLAPRWDLTLRYALASDLPTQRNEWEPMLRCQLLDEHGPVHLTGALAYNSEAISVDARLLAGVELGALSLRAMAGELSSGFGVGGPTATMGAGLVWQISPLLGVSADYGGVVAAQNLEAIANQLPTLGMIPAWSVGTQVRLPSAGALVRLYVTNAENATLQGTSRGSGAVQTGFEIEFPFRGPDFLTGLLHPAPADPYASLPLVPAVHAATNSPGVDVTVAPIIVDPQPEPVDHQPVIPVQDEPPPAPRPRKVVHHGVAPVPRLPVVHLPHAVAERALAPRPQGPRAQVVEVVIDGKRFNPRVLVVKRGTVIRWVNKGRFANSATAESAVFDSHWLKHGMRYARRFDVPGVYGYFSKPHPELRGVVKVE